MRCAFMDRECSPECRAAQDGGKCARLYSIIVNRDSLDRLSRSMESAAAVLDEAMTLAKLAQNSIIKRFLPKGSKVRK